VIKRIGQLSDSIDDASSTINHLLDPIPESFIALTVARFRTLLSHLNYHSPLLDSCVSALIGKYPLLCSVVSEQGNYALHEQMLAHHHSGTTNKDLLSDIIAYFPGAVRLSNKKGDLPLHCLLGGDPCGSETVSALQLLIRDAPDTVR
jgi:hypothetical protein